MMPTLEEFISSALESLAADAAHRLAPGQPDHGRLCEAYALAKRLDVILAPRFPTAPIQISLIETRDLNHLLEKIAAADLQLIRISSQQQGCGPGSVTEHRITLKGLETAITVIEQQRPEATAEAQP